jgi:Flp pilus assembly protein TadG
MRSGSASNPIMFTAQRGVAAVEMGIVLALLVVLLTGIFNFGLAIYRYDSLVKEVRSGVRYLSINTPDSIHRNKAIALMVCGDPDGNPSECTSIIPGLTSAMIQICDSNNNPCGDSHKDVQVKSGSETATFDLVTVKIVDYPFSFRIPFVQLGDIKFGEIRASMIQGA